MSHNCLIQICMLNSLMMLLFAISLVPKTFWETSESVFDQSGRFNLEGTFSTANFVSVQSQWACTVFWHTWPTDTKQSCTLFWQTFTREMHEWMVSHSSAFICFVRLIFGCFEFNPLVIFLLPNVLYYNLILMSSWFASFLLYKFTCWMITTILLSLNTDVVTAFSNKEHLLEKIRTTDKLHKTCRDKLVPEFFRQGDTHQVPVLALWDVHSGTEKVWRVLFCETCFPSLVQHYSERSSRAAFQHDPAPCFGLIFFSVLVFPPSLLHFARSRSICMMNSFPNQT